MVRVTAETHVGASAACEAAFATEAGPPFAPEAPQLVKGPGVVGQQPVLEPGQSFEYSSACPITCAPKEGYQVRRRSEGKRGGVYIAKRRRGSVNFFVCVNSLVVGWGFVTCGLAECVVAHTYLRRF